MASSISSQRRLNHKILVLLNYFRIRLSANRHVKRGGTVLWAAITKFLIIVGVFSTLGRVITNGIPQMVENAKIAIGRDPLGQAATVKIASNGRSIEVVGMLSQGSSEQFGQILNAASGVETVVLNSSGGRLVEAETIAGYVRSRNLKTYVEGKCESACTLILIAGRDRASTAKARIGFHQPDFPGLDPETRSATIAANRQLYRQAGINEAFIDRAMQAAPNSMWYPSQSEMLEAGVLTRTSLGGETATTFSAVSSREELASLLQKQSLFRTLEQTRPKLFNSVVDAAWQSKIEGNSDNDILSAGRGKLASELPIVLAKSDNIILREYFGLVLEQITAARTVSYDACSRYMKGKLNIAVTLPSSLSTREVDLLERALKLSQNQKMNPSLAKRGYEMLSLMLSEANIDVLTAPDKATPEQQCDSNISFYSAIAKLPAAEQTAVIRDIFSQAQKGT